MVFDQKYPLDPMSKRCAKNDGKLGKFTRKSMPQTEKMSMKTKPLDGASPNAPDCGLMRPV
jgi:hypothetical protein